MKKYSFISLWILLITAVIFPPSAHAAIVSGPVWEIAAVADFNGDGTKGVLWRNGTTGEVALWHMHGCNLVSEEKIRIASDSAAWDVAGVGDFNKDGHADILLWNNTNGDVRICYLNGSAVVGEDTIAGIGGPWKIVGVGDFNRDGNTDILWRNSITGETIVWYMKDAFHLNTAFLEALPPPWKIVCVNDFDHDGSPDILWKNSATGNIVVWFMRSLVHVDLDTIAARAPPPIIAESCNFNGDVHPNIDWRHIAILSVAYPLFPGDAPCSIIFSSLYIRAPPIPLLYS